MYSRSSRASGDYRIPDNYHGNAFPPIAPEETQTPEPPPAEPEKEPEAKPAVLLSSLLPPKPSGLGGILGNIGTEELLILGIILLLSGSETDDDILLLLILLLFYK